ncbi:Hypothetical protein NTJ_14198 [Nesidiocoris tenuis]|uniref:HAUS augmin-like complex subunit 3 N-terminal domain-containing protein n=1 Tax=Nesidiocoris tenuis TaxID=355587 RepID=A0ABN7BAH3_9HEMI|nr:Hypothetical protein NTJ_14198 [Nesidiocoris tenuis]
MMIVRGTSSQIVIPIRFSKMSNIFQSLLRKSGYIDELPSSLEPILRVPEMADFFSWMEKHVDDSNILTTGEIATQRALQEADALIEDGTELSDRYDSLFTGETSVYPHLKDLPVLESTKQRLTENLNSWEQFEKNTKSVEEKFIEEIEKPIEPAIEKLLASEKRKIDDLISAQLGRITCLASSADRLRFKSLQSENECELNNRTVAVPSAELISSMNILDEYSKTLIKHSLLKLEQDYTFGSDDSELKRVFNECIRLQRIELLLEAQYCGVLAALDAFADHTWFKPRPSCFSEISQDEIDSICLRKAKLAFCQEEVNFGPSDLETRRQTLDHLNRLADIVEPLRLCGDSIVRMARSSRRWMKKVDALHSQICCQLEEACTRIRVNRERLNAAKVVRKLHHQNQKLGQHWHSISVLEQRRPVDRVQQYVNDLSQYKSHCPPASLQNSIIVSAHDSGVSSLSHFDQLIAGSHDVANSTARSDWLFVRPTSTPLPQPSSYLQNLIMFSDQGPELDALRNLAIFFADSQTTFSSIKSVVESVFREPIASPSFDDEIMKSIFESADRLNEIHRLFDQSQKSWISSQDSCRYDFRNRLVKQFWYFCYRDPENLIRTVKCLEEVAHSFHRPAALPLTPSQPKPRCSLLDDLET